MPCSLTRSDPRRRSARSPRPCEQAPGCRGRTPGSTHDRALDRRHPGAGRDRCQSLREATGEVPQAGTAKGDQRVSWREPSRAVAHDGRHPEAVGASEAGVQHRHGRAPGRRTSGPRARRGRRGPTASTPRRRARAYRTSSASAVGRVGSARRCAGLAGDRHRHRAEGWRDIDCAVRAVTKELPVPSQAEGSACRQGEKPWSWAPAIGTTSGGAGPSVGPDVTPRVATTPGDAGAPARRRDGGRRCSAGPRGELLGHLRRPPEALGRQVGGQVVARG